MNRISQQNKYVGRGVEGLLLSLIIWAAVDYYNGSNSASLISSIVIFIVDLIITEVLIRQEKKIEKIWPRYYFCCIYGLAFAMVFAFTQFPTMLAFAFIANSLIIIYHDIKYTLFSLGAIIVVVTSILGIRVKTGTVNVTEANLSIFILINDLIVWFLTNKMQTKFSHEDKTIIVEQEKSQKEAEASAKAKSNFLANMSHEIRTPMNAICGMTELLLQLELKPIELEYVSTIHASSKILLDIINDILDFSKIDVGRMELIEDDYILTSSINDIQNIIISRIGGKNIAFTININPDIPVKLCGDEIRIRQILLNLLNNAVKFTKCGEVHLEVDFEQINEERIKLIVEVSDTGIGIKQEELGVLFEAFYQVDMRKNRSVEGTGLGLAIAKRLAELMNGEISVVSNYGRGSTFRVTFEQKVVDVNSTSKFEEADRNEIVIFEPNPYYAANIKQILDSLHIKNKRIHQLEELNLYQFTKPNRYIMFDYSCGISFINQYQKEHTDVVCIAMLEGNALLEETIEQNIIVTHKPVSLYPMLSLLNGEYHSNVPRKILNAFIAPNAKVLVVDDNAFNLKVANGFLKTYQVQVTLAMSGKEAIDKIKTYPEFDIIFMDHMMPEMDGIETTKQIRNLEIEYVKTVPIVALTANAIKGVEKMFLENEMNDFLAKPIEPKRLAKIMKKWIPKEKQLRAYVVSNEEPIVQEEKQEKEEKQETLIDQLRGIDTKIGIKNSMGSTEMYLELLKTFYVSTTKDKKTIIQAYKEKDLVNYAIYSHGLKSATKTIGATLVSEYAAYMENASKNKEWLVIERNHEKFMDKLESILQELSSFFETKEKEIKDSEEIQEETYIWKSFLGEVNEAAAEYDMLELEQCVKKVIRNDLSLEQQVIFSEIEKLVSAFEYEEIEEITRYELEKLTE